MNNNLYAKPLDATFSASDFPWFPMFGERWLLSRSVRLMTYEQRGIYQELLCIAWRDQGIPADLEDVAALLGIDMDRLEVAWRRIGKLFEPAEWSEDVLVNRWQEEIRAEQVAKFAKRSAASQKAHAARWGQRNECESHANCGADACQGEGEGEDKGGPAATPIFDPLKAIWDGLPDTHRIQAVGEALKAYLAMRRGLKVTQWKAPTCATWVKKFGDMTPEQVVATLDHSTQNQYQGLFPEKFTKAGRPVLSVVNGSAIPPGQTSTMTPAMLANVARG
jgi:uncharacterized protein YdaU (DUF1376 family)